MDFGFVKVAGHTATSSRNVEIKTNYYEKELRRSQILGLASTLAVGIAGVAGVGAVGVAWHLDKKKYKK